jgi:peptidylprolyl isomerase
MASIGIAGPGSKVKVEYTGKLTDGNVFDSSVGRQPLAFTVGAEQMIRGFDKAVKGMKVGECKTVTIPAEEAYGPRREDMVITAKRDQLPPSMDPKIGDRLGMGQPNGVTLPVTVTAVTATTFTVDANHFLAGKDLVFEIKLVEIGK